MTLVPGGFHNTDHVLKAGSEATDVYFQALFLMYIMLFCMSQTLHDEEKLFGFTNKTKII